MQVQTGKGTDRLWQNRQKLQKEAVVLEPYHAGIWMICIQAPVQR